jgi:hypothetical protein
MKGPKARSNTPLETYFRHFQALCRSLQKQAPQERTTDDEYYEHGCARLVGCADGTAFDMLVAMPTESMYALLPPRLSVPLRASGTSVRQQP